MAPLAPHLLDRLWRREALPGNALAAAFALIDAWAAEASQQPALDGLFHSFLGAYLPDDILTKTDRASMFNGLEVRAPVLDRAFAEYACRLPTGLKLRGRTKKYILKRLASRYLPQAIVHRRSTVSLCRSGR